MRPIRRQRHTHSASPIFVGSGFDRHYAARPGACGKPPGALYTGSGKGTLLSNYRPMWTVNLLAKRRCAAVPSAQKDLLWEASCSGAKTVWSLASAQERPRVGSRRFRFQRRAGDRVGVRSPATHTFPRCYICAVTKRLGLQYGCSTCDSKRRQVPDRSLIHPANRWKRESRRADSNRFAAPGTSDRSGVAGVCSGLQMPLIQAGFSSVPCLVLHRVEFPVVSVWCQSGQNLARRRRLAPSRLLLCRRRRRCEVAAPL